MKNFILRGKWWLPGNTNKINGSLYSDEDGLFLQTEEHFKNTVHSLFRSFSIIHGDAQGEQYTLLNAYAFHPHREKRGYKPSAMLKGIHLTSVDEHFVTGIEFSCEELNEWLYTSGFQQAIDTDEQGISVQYRRPDAILFKVSDRISGQFGFSFSVNSDVKQVDVHQEAVVSLNFVEYTLPFEDALSHYATFLRFLTFASQKVPDIDSITLKTAKGEVTYFYKPRNTDTDFKGHFLFRKNELTNFESVIEKWFTLDQKPEPFLQILFETYFPDAVFNENAFMNQCQAVETFHRALYPVTTETMDSFKKRRTAILEKIETEEDKKWLKEKLAFAFEPSLKQRLDFLLTKINKLNCVKTLKLDNDFTRWVVDNRNHYTHYGEGKKQYVVKGTELARLTVRLKIMLKLLLLEELGFEPVLIDKFVGSGRFMNWAFLMTPSQVNTKESQQPNATAD